jgi:cyclic beta-1,2-glucan synthetase
MTSDELVHIENQKQAADQVSISNSIGSLRFLSSNNWRDFVENISIVENILRSENCGVYPLMDFQTRDEYRHSVEKIAKAGNRSESSVAHMALEQANENFKTRTDYPRSGHLGFFLIGRGFKDLARRSGARFPFGERFKNFCKKIPLLLYSGSSFFLAAFMAGTLILRSWEDGFRNPWLLGVTAFFCLIGCSQLSISLVNWVCTLIIRPLILPRMDFEEAIP